MVRLLQREAGQQHAQEVLGQEILALKEKIMPLPGGKENIGKNIQTEESHGKPHKQAVAIALDVARRSGADIPEKHQMTPGMVETQEEARRGSHPLLGEAAAAEPERRAPEYGGSVGEPTVPKPELYAKPNVKEAIANEHAIAKKYKGHV